VICVAAPPLDADTSRMALTTLDTHELVKDLKAAGFTDDQAEAVTRAVKQGREIDFSDLATKADLANVATKSETTALSAKIDALTARLDNFLTKAEAGELKTDIMKWVVSIALGQAALIIALIKLLPGGHP
jgi:phage I-like protein